MRIEFKELIFGRVEAPFSPRKVAGYQVISHSAGISKALSGEIEAIVRFFKPIDEFDERLQFTELSDGAALISRTCQAEQSREVFDQNGRTSFLAHGIVVEPDQMEKIDWDPFWAIDAFSFVQTAEEVLQRIDHVESGETSVIEAPRLRRRHVAEHDASSARLKTLMTWAAGASRMKKRGESIQLVGERSQIEQAIRETFTLCARSSRRACSFDTAVDGRQVKPGSYLFVGVTRKESKSGFRSVKVSKIGEGGEKESEPPDRKMRFGKWRGLALGTFDASDVLALSPEARLVCDCFESNEHLTADEIDAIDSEAFPLLLKVLRKEVTSSIGTLITPFLPRILAPVVARKLVQSLEAQDSVSLAIRDEVSVDELRALVDSIPESSGVLSWPMRHFREELMGSAEADDSLQDDEVEPRGLPGDQGEEDGSKVSSIGTKRTATEGQAGD